MTKFLLHLTSLTTLIVLPFSAYAETLQGKVIGVSDGDTLSVLVNASKPIKVRLIGIDAPEKKQPYGEKSKLNLSRLVFGKTVEIDWSHRDRYGRVIGKVLATYGKCSQSQCPTLDVGLTQIRGGFAWHYKQYQSEQTTQDRLLYSNAEKEARREGVGLWSESQPTPPWDFRKSKRSF